MKETITKLTCDLCKESSGKSIQNWIEISIANKHLDRDWFDKHICPSCLKLIQFKLDKYDVKN